MKLLTELQEVWHNKKVVVQRLWINQNKKFDRMYSGCSMFLNDLEQEDCKKISDCLKLLRELQQDVWHNI